MHVTTRGWLSTAKGLNHFVDDPLNTRPVRSAVAGHPDVELGTPHQDLRPIAVVGEGFAGWVRAFRRSRTDIPEYSARALRGR
jgi:hypothetical protein